VWCDRRYRTDEHIIPFGLFWIYYRALESNLALERVQQLRAVGGAIGVAFGKGSELPPSVQSDLRDAYLS
jgi:hypothetical protein